MVSHLFAPHNGLLSADYLVAGPESRTVYSLAFEIVGYVLDGTAIELTFVDL